MIAIEGFLVRHSRCGSKPLKGRAFKLLTLRESHRLGGIVAVLLWPSDFWDLLPSFPLICESIPTNIRPALAL